MIFLRSQLVLFTVLISVVVYGQTNENAVFGAPLPSEIHMTEYENDLDASAVVLFESGVYYIDMINDEPKLMKLVHRKIKVFDATKYGQEFTEIPYRIGNDKQEEITNIIALTHNDTLKSEVKRDDLFFIYEGGESAYLRFAFPNVKDGSILEYLYSIESPFFSNFGDWQFQGILPKIYSKFTSVIPAYYRYNRVLYGNEKLSENIVSDVNNCFRSPKFKTIADCEKTSYAMENIPAFEEEPFMLSGKNYISRVEYELREKVNFKGKKLESFDSWKDIDKTFQKKNEVGKNSKIFLISKANSLNQFERSKIHMKKPKLFIHLFRIISHGTKTIFYQE